MKVFIDGSAGTTGLRIADRLAGRSDIEMLVLSENERKNSVARSEMLNAADIAFLCLPDAAAIEAEQMVKAPHVRVVDTSTAHRTSAGWSYGFPELSAEHRRSIAQGKRIAVPGCHASGFCSIVYPLVSGGIIGNDYPVVCHSVTGYSGGGKKMIAEYTESGRSALLDSPAQYALTGEHKHLKEMQHVCSLSEKPVFDPIIGDFYSGMTVCVPLHARLMKKRMSVESLRRFFEEYYACERLISVLSDGETGDMCGRLYTNTLSGKDTMQIFVGGNDERPLLASRFCNLGKGASGAAVQCMNLMLGLDETTGLEL